MRFAMYKTYPYPKNAIFPQNVKMPVTLLLFQIEM